MSKKNVGLFIFSEAEVLDIGGPFEVFSVASELSDHTLFDVFTVGKTQAPILAVNGLSINPKFSFENHPKIDILIIVGGSGTRALLEDSETLKWIETVHQTTEITMSICSGARLLGKLGLLDKLPFCTHHQVYNHMEVIAPTAIPMKHKRFHKTGKIYTSGGISAGIDLSFHILETLLGSAITQQTARYMEYDLKTVS